MRRFPLFFLALLLSAQVTGCRTAQPSPETAVPSVAAPMYTKTDSVYTLPASVQPVYTTPALLPRITDAIGLSTPEGRARRQARRDVAATVPRKLGKGAVYAPQARAVVNAYKPRAAVVQADSGAVVTAIGKNKGVAATAPNATATQTTTKPGFWATVGAAVLGNLTWLLVLALAGLWFVRKQLPVVGHFFA